MRWTIGFTSSIQMLLCSATYLKTFIVTEYFVRTKQLWAGYEITLDRKHNKINTAYQKLIELLRVANDFCYHINTTNKNVLENQP